MLHNILNFSSDNPAVMFAAFLAGSLVIAVLYFAMILGMDYLSEKFSNK